MEEERHKPTETVAGPKKTSQLTTLETKVHPKTETDSIHISKAEAVTCKKSPNWKITPGELRDQGDAKWIVIKRSLLAPGV
jgi:hypothetical protein